MQTKIPNIDYILKGHDNDIMKVTNPDLNCDEVDTMEGWEHKEYFQVKWDGRPYRIAPGETKLMMRWLAKHYAKHLADHILIKEDPMGSRGLLSSPVRRPQVLASIILSCEQKFEEDTPLTEGQKVEQEVNRINEPESAVGSFFNAGKASILHETNLGAMPDPIVGNLKKEPKPIDEILKTAGEDKESTSEDKDPNGEKVKSSLFDPKKPLPSRRELFEECARLGIDVTGKEKVEELIQKVKSF